VICDLHSVVLCGGCTVAQRRTVLHFNPPNTPDFNPIEHMFNAWKAPLKRDRTDTFAALDLAVQEASKRVTRRSCVASWEDMRSMTSIWHHLKESSAKTYFMSSWAKSDHDHELHPELAFLTLRIHSFHKHMHLLSAMRELST
jgi:hypothetical protein